MAGYGVRVGRGVTVGPNVGLSVGSPVNAVGFSVGSFTVGACYENQNKDV